MGTIKEISDIRVGSKEGKMLMAALAFITTTNRSDKTPFDVLDELNTIKEKMTFTDHDLSFGESVEAAKSGKKVARRGWNGQGMYAYIVPANSYPAVTDIARAQFGEMVPYRAYWALKTAQNDVATWAPSGSDSLADDWMIV